MARPVYIINGPNLNRLGLREPEIYGTLTLADLERRCHAHAQSLSLSVEFRQSNHEGQLIDWIHEATDRGSAIIINPAAYTHSSIALHDALKAADIPIIEVHLSNIHAREPFRHHSFVSPVVLGIICGFGVAGYELALDAVHPHISDRA
jgi:3-dehydroquinate dehydratase II